MKITIADATYADLKDYAESNGLEVGIRMPPPALRKLIRTAFPTLTHIEVDDNDPRFDMEPDEPVVEVVAKPRDRLTDAYRDDPKVTVMIQSDDLTGKHHLPLMVNGDHILVQRDVPISIPMRFFRALESMVEETYSQKWDRAEMRNEIITTQRRSIQYSVIDMPSQAEIIAWQERTKDIGRGDDAMIEFRKMSTIGQLLTQAG